MLGSRACLLLLVTSMAWAQVASAPQVLLGGILETPKKRYAVIKAPAMTFVVPAGQSLGDYTVAEVGPDSVKFAYGKQSWDFKLKPDNAGHLLALSPEARNPMGPADTISLRLQSVKNKPALRLIATSVDKSIYTDPSVQGTVDINLEHGSAQGLLECLAARLTLQVVERLGIVCVVPKAIADKELSVAGMESLEGQVKLDFTEADLVYVLFILAKESSRSLVLAANVKGTVTVTTDSAQPIKNLFALMCWDQAMPLQASAQTGFLTVANDLPTLTDPPNGPPINYDAGGQPKVVPVADVLKLVAAKTDLKLVLPPGFQARAYVELRNAPALSACERMLAVNGYAYRVEQRQLIVERR